MINKEEWENMSAEQRWDEVLRCQEAEDRKLIARAVAQGLATEEQFCELEQEFRLDQICKALQTLHHGSYEELRDACLTVAYS